jgi:hypothetical protein
MSKSEQTAGSCCNVCGGTERDHHLVTATERVYGASVWVYDDGYARVVRSLTRSLLTDGNASDTSTEGSR